MEGGERDAVKRKERKEWQETRIKKEEDEDRKVRQNGREINDQWVERRKVMKRDVERGMKGKNRKRRRKRKERKEKRIER